MVYKKERISYKNGLGEIESRRRNRQMIKIYVISKTLKGKFYEKKKELEKDMS